MEKGKQLSTHTRNAIIPRAIKRFDRFITVRVENYYECARNISYFSLFHGKGNGEIEDGEVCYKKKKCFKGRSIKKEPEWNLPKIDLNELKRYQFKGVQYDRGLADERGEVDVIPHIRRKKLKRDTQAAVSVVRAVPTPPPPPLTPAGQLVHAVQHADINQMEDQVLVELPPMDQYTNTVQYISSETGTTYMQLQ